MGGLVWLLLPGRVITLDDDFWYLRSVIKTLQKGRPWTDDWLTPWAASASSISALLFKVTGSFTLAIHGQLTAAAGLAAMATTLFLKRQGTPALPALATALLVLATPTVLFMFLMFTGVALYMACLWWCLLLADRRQWLWFLLPWGLAVASRQSAVVWLALPGWALLQEAWGHRTLLPRTPDARRLFLTFSGAAAIFLTCKLGMNPTEGQKLVLGGLGMTNLTAESAVSPTLGLLAFMAGLGISSLLRLPGLSGRRPNHYKVRLALLPVLAAAGAWGALWFRTSTINTHDCYNNAFSDTILPALGAGLGAALALAAPRPRADASLAAVGTCCLLFLYNGRFDYYFSEVLFFGIAAGFPMRSRQAAGPAPVAETETEQPMVTGNEDPSQALPAPRRWYASLARCPRARIAASGLLLLTAGATAVWHARSAVRLAVQQERGGAAIELYELAMRTGKLAPADVGMATFGYLGWLFQDYYAAHEGKAAPTLGGFSRYAQNWDAGRGTGIITTLPKALRPWRDLIPSRNRAALRDTPGVPVLLEIERPLLGRYPVRFTLLRGPSAERVPGSLTIDPAAYQRIPFPLNDAEWRHLILDAPPLP
jgi:hypothetical protein